MKKRVIAVVLLVAMVLTGCGSKGFTGVDIDTEQEDGSMKSEASKSGAYDMKNEPGKKWHEQVDLLEETIVKDEFSLDKITCDDEGKPDAISGVTIKVNGYLDAVQDALDQAK